MATFDNYLPCPEYQSAPGSEKYPGFSTWFDEKTSAFYFGFVMRDGTVLLRSEAYTTEAARDNGIESVMRNREISERYKVIQDEADGKWYVTLRAGNNQEIARSCAHDSETAATGAVALTQEPDVATRAVRSKGITDNYMPCEDYKNADKSKSYPGFNIWEAEGSYFFGMVNSAGDVLLRSEAYTTEKARDNGIESVIKNRELEERYKIIQDEEDGQWYVTLRAGNNQEIGRSCAYDSEAAAVAGRTSTVRSGTALRAAANKFVDNYLDCDTYKVAPKSAKYKGFNTWYNEEDSSYYFALTAANGDVLLRSEAYTTESARDNGIESVMKNRDIEARYKVVGSDNDFDNNFYLILRAGNNQEIGRSCPYYSEEAALIARPKYFSTYKEPARAAKGKKSKKKDKKSKAKVAPVEEYLPCEAYANHTKSEKYEGFTTFVEGGQYYFAMVDKNGKVVLKSEGYKAIEGRDNGIESVIKNRDTEARWKKMHSAEEGHYMSLRAGNSLEIARTCGFESEGALLGWWTPFAALAPWALLNRKEEPAKPAVVVPPPPPAIQTPPPPPPVAPPPPPAPKAVYNETATAAVSEGGSDWWKWLLGLLLLAGLLFLLMRGCDGCNDKKAITAVPPVVAPKVDTVKAVPPPPAPAPTCNCSEATDPVFKTPMGTPKKLSRLGTNPEFGNSHAFDAPGFYAKLADRYKSSAVDKAFLDRMFKAMGYSGFADATAEQFSEVVLPVGTSGNLGYSKMHKTGYYTLPDSENDREAFRIKSANGCDLHFMKTCGNHFFACPN